MPRCSAQVSGRLHQGRADALPPGSSAATWRWLSCTTRIRSSRTGETQADAQEGAADDRAVDLRDEDPAEVVLGDTAATAFAATTSRGVAGRVGLRSVRAGRTTDGHRRARVALDRIPHEHRHGVTRRPLQRRSDGLELDATRRSARARASPTNRP